MTAAGNGGYNAETKRPDVYLADMVPQVLSKTFTPLISVGGVVSHSFNISTTIPSLAGILPSPETHMVS